MPSMSSLNFVSTAANGTVLDDCFKRETQVTVVSILVCIFILYVCI